MIEAPQLTERYLPGTPVEVHNRYTDTWSRGFCVEERLESGYRLRRLSDGATLPVVFSLDDVRERARPRAELAAS